MVVVVEVVLVVVLVIDVSGRYGGGGIGRGDCVCGITLSD